MNKKAFLVYLYPIYILVLLEVGSLITATLLSMKSHPVSTQYSASLIAQEEDISTESSHDELTSWTEYPHPYFGASYPHKKEGSRNAFRTLRDFGFKSDAGKVFTRRSPDTFIINITGGSVAKNFLDYGGAQVLKEKLESLPSFAGKNIVFSSTAFYGHKHPQQLMGISYMLIMGAKFDMVISIDGFNEITFGKVYNESPGTSPYYPFKWHWFLTQNIPDSITKKLGDNVQYLMRRQRETAQSFMESPFRWSSTASLIWQILNKKQEEEIAKAQYELSTNAPNELEKFIDSGPFPSYSGTEDYLRDQVSVWKESTRQLARLSKANRIEFFSVLQPNQYYGNHPMNVQERREAWKEDSEFRELVEKGYPMLRNAGSELAEEGITFVDASLLFDDFNEPVYTDNCCHFNRKVPNVMLAELIVDAIRIHLAQ